jgi:serine/threonine-protein kinase RsbW
MQDPLVFPSVDAGRVVSEPPIVLIIPAQLRYVALARSVAGHLGAQAGLTVTEITDLRLAVDESCALLVDGTRDGEMWCRFVQDEPGLRIAFFAAGCPLVRPDTNGFGWLVLSALVDELNWSHVDGGARVDLLKRPVERDTS